MDSSSLIKCTILTPSSEIHSKEGDMIVLPGQEGELGILLNHMNLITELKAGSIRIYLKNSIIEEILIKEGIAFIKNDLIEIFG